MKKNRLTTFIILLFTTFILASSMYFTYIRWDLPLFISSDPNSYHDENNIIFEWEVCKLKEGMSYYEIIRAIGKPNRTVGSGFWIMEYACFGGKYLYVYEHNAHYFFAEDNAGWLVDDIYVDRITPAVVCLAASAIVIWGGYSIYRGKTNIDPAAPKKTHDAADTE